MLNYFYEVVEWTPEQRFVMRTTQGHFPMETTCERDDAPGRRHADAASQPAVSPRGFQGSQRRLMSPAIERVTKGSAAAEDDPRSALRRAVRFNGFALDICASDNSGYAVAEGFEPPDGFSRLSLSRRVH
jgi:hypothetical protein